MLFSSITFLYFFLPLVLLLYYFVDRKFKNLLLYFCSITFYAWGAPLFVFVMLVVTFIDFHLVKLMAKQTRSFTSKLLLVVSLSLNLGLLFYFKNCNFFIENINDLLSLLHIGLNFHALEVIMPIGISFYTFETVTYVVDIYRKEHKPLSSFMDYQLYIFFFPKLIAGPIVRYQQIADQISGREETSEKWLAGFTRFVIGLAKKVLIANTIAACLTAMLPANNESLSVPEAWLKSIGYSFQLYFDFSGYSDMALGLAAMFGFRLPENFNFPYSANSITDFWRRWHITLGSWMRNYLYIPLGGNRVKSKLRLYFNLWLVFLASGFWHGASWNFVLWGVFHGVFMIAEKLWYGRFISKLGNILSVPLTFLIVNFGWILFSNTNLSEAFAHVHAMFSGVQKEMTGPDLELLSVLIVAALFSFIGRLSIADKMINFFYGQNKSFSARLVSVALTLVLLLLTTAYLSGSNFNPFIYFRF